MRHVYQHIEIEKYKTHSNECSSKYIERWIQEGNSYIQSLDGNGNENIDYFKQDCELDAYVFSYALMHYKYKGKLGSRYGKE